MGVFFCFEAISHKKKFKFFLKKKDIFFGIFQQRWIFKKKTEKTKNMPSVYVSTTVVQKLRLCDTFFAQNKIECLDDLDRCPLFRKINMPAYLRQLCVRSLRSKRSCMASLVNTMCARNPIFAELFAQTKNVYEKQHPPRPPSNPRTSAVVGSKHITTRPKPIIRTRELAKKSPKPRPQPRKQPQPKKEKPPKQTPKLPKFPKLPKLPKEKPLTQARRKPTKPTVDAKRHGTAKSRRIEPTQQRRTINGGIGYAQQQYLAQDTVIYVGLDDFVQCERARLNIDIVSLTHAIEYASRKMSAAYDTDQLLNDVFTKLRVS